MISVAIIFLICATFAENAVYVGRGYDTADDPLNVKITKLLDVNLESKASSWKNDLSRFYQPQREDNDIDKKDGYVQIPMKFSFAVDEKRNPNILEGCRNLVGVSQPSLCFLKSSSTAAEKYIAYPRSCREIQENGNNKSGIYEIKPRTSSKPFAVLCDMEIQGGGWTHIQKRFDGSQEFYQMWRDYKFGFGNLDGEFWIGLENIYHMTGFEANELLIELTDKEKKTGHAHYTSFAIGPEKDGYKLTVLNGYSGDIGDGLNGHLNAKFSTKDMDLDENSGSCATTYEGGWWYKSCYTSCLNGKYSNVIVPDGLKYHGINWNGFRSKEYNLSGSRIMIRPIGS
ncbi:microfibril-associated glycoprotein 4-like isoform X1 [Diabrotica undecimpunctata]|uniref:microfibril-associated glycoprotein 4-like isoform X1 n=1 Tax=Diabrotica undecimpunctata TaxID=50387 RepID=UPI003B640C4E